MAKVAEHDAEEEGEHNTAEGARVALAVARGAVRVDEALEARGELRHGHVRRRQPRDSSLLMIGRVSRPHSTVASCSAATTFSYWLSDPTLGDEDVALDVKLAHVERVEDHLLREGTKFHVWSSRVGEHLLAAPAAGAALAPLDEAPSPSVRHRSVVVASRNL